MCLFLPRVRNVFNENIIVFQLKWKAYTIQQKRVFVTKHSAKNIVSTIGPDNRSFLQNIWSICVIPNPPHSKYWLINSASTCIGARTSSLAHAYSEPDPMYCRKRKVNTTPAGIHAMKCVIYANQVYFSSMSCFMSSATRPTRIHIVHITANKPRTATSTMPSVSEIAQIQTGVASAHST